MGGLEFLTDKHALALAAFPGGNKVLDDLLGLAKHLGVRICVKMRAGGDVRPPTPSGMPCRWAKSIK
jgi:hypothetical protein